MNIGNTMNNISIYLFGPTLNNSKLSTKSVDNPVNSLLNSLKIQPIVSLIQSSPICVKPLGSLHYGREKNSK